MANKTHDDVRGFDLTLAYKMLLDGYLRGVQTAETPATNKQHDRNVHQITNPPKGQESS